MSRKRRNGWGFQLSADFSAQRTAHRGCVRAAHVAVFTG